MYSVNEYKNKIIELQKKKEYKEAYELNKTALGFYPSNLFFLTSEIYSLYKLKKITEARQKAEQRIEYLKNDIFFLKTYLLILEKLDAKEDIEQFIEKTIFSAKIGNEDLYVFVSQIVERIFGREKAIDIIKRALLLFHDSKILKELANNFDKKKPIGNKYKYYSEKFDGKKNEEIIQEIESIRMLPNYANDPDLIIYLAEIYKKEKKYNKAIDLYKNALILKDCEFTRKMLGYTYYKLGDVKNALIYLRDIFLQCPNDHFLYSTIYKIFETTRDLEELNKLVNEAISIHPESKHLYGLLGKTKKWRKNEKNSKIND